MVIQKNNDLIIGFSYKPTYKIALILLEKFKNHIGQLNCISKTDLYFYLFKEKYSQSSLKSWMRWEFVKKAMRKCRTKSKCFITYVFVDNEFYFFVAKDNLDINTYTKQLSKNIEKMKYMQKRAQESIDKQWYKQNWGFENIKKLK